MDDPNGMVGRFMDGWDGELWFVRAKKAGDPVYRLERCSRGFVPQNSGVWVTFERLRTSYCLHRRQEHESLPAIVLLAEPSFEPEKSVLALTESEYVNFFRQDSQVENREKEVKESPVGVWLKSYDGENIKIMWR